MFTYGFYNSLNGDRKYDALQMSSIFDGIIEDGVFSNVGEIFAVAAGTGMQVVVKTGRAWFKHTWNLNDSWMPLTIEPSDVLRPRIDSVVIEVNSNLEVRTSSIKVVKGIPESEPTPPTMTHANGIDQYRLADITVSAAATAIVASNIANKVGQGDTPFVTAPLKSVDITDLYAQWEGEFDEWFDNVKAQLSDNVVTNLQRQIDEKLDASDKATEADIANKTPNKWVDSALLASDAGRYLNTTPGTVVSSGENLEELYPDKYMACDQRVVVDPAICAQLKKKYFRPTNGELFIPTWLTSNIYAEMLRRGNDPNVRLGDDYVICEPSSKRLYIFHIDTRTYENVTLGTSNSINAYSVMTTWNGNFVIVDPLSGKVYHAPYRKYSTELKTYNVSFSPEDMYTGVYFIILNGSKPGRRFLVAVDSSNAQDTIDYAKMWVSDNGFQTITSIPSFENLFKNTVSKLLNWDNSNYGKYNVPFSSTFGTVDDSKTWYFVLNANNSTNLKICRLNTEQQSVEAVLTISVSSLQNQYISDYNNAIPNYTLNNVSNNNTFFGLTSNNKLILFQTVSVSAGQTGIASVGLVTVDLATNTYVAKQCIRRDMFYPFTNNYTPTESGNIISLVYEPTGEPKVLITNVPMRKDVVETITQSDYSYKQLYTSLINQRYCLIDLKCENVRIGPKFSGVDITYGSGMSTLNQIGPYVVGWAQGISYTNNSSNYQYLSASPGVLDPIYKTEMSSKSPFSSNLVKIYVIDTRDVSKTTILSHFPSNLNDAAMVPDSFTNGAFYDNVDDSVLYTGSCQKDGDANYYGLFRISFNHVVLPYSPNEYINIEEGAENNG